MGRSVWPKFPSRYAKGEKWSIEVARRVNITMDSDAASALLMWDEILSSNNPSAFERAIASSSIRFPRVTPRHVTSHLLDLVLLSPQCRIRRERMPSSWMGISPRRIRCYRPFQTQESFKAGSEGLLPLDTGLTRNLSVACGCCRCVSGGRSCSSGCGFGRRYSWNVISRLGVCSSSIAHRKSPGHPVPVPSCYELFQAEHWQKQSPRSRRLRLLAAHPLPLLPVTPRSVSGRRNYLYASSAVGVHDADRCRRNRVDLALSGFGSRTADWPKGKRLAAHRQSLDNTAILQYRRYRLEIILCAPPHRSTGLLAPA
ncbi:hypothetical protein C8F01DRAFT_690378 [Mycena amicta]|nr:hypothetical protein C8F01DRAFT_690378 [Mycena amicta]